MPLDHDAFIGNHPARQTLARIAGKWTALVVGALEDGPRRHGELKSIVSGISQKMLTQTLRSLEQDGLVERHPYPSVPPKVEYSLTPLGRTLVEPLAGIRAWAEAHADEVEAAHRRRQAAGTAYRLPSRAMRSV